MSSGPERRDESPAADGPEGLPRGGPEDEPELRRLLRDAVRDVEPSRDALEHLRHAVPARRARKRQIMVGATAAVLVTAVSVPLMTTGVVPGPLGADERTNAAHSTDAGGGKPYGGRDSAGADGSPDAAADAAHPEDGLSAAPTEGTTRSPDDPGLGSSSPRCLRDQLGEAAAQVGDPDGGGVVHGSFRLTNVSGDSCRVDGDDQLTATAQGEADAEAVTVLDHTDGGRATGLPSPSESDGALILRPGESYEVRFAWLPDTARGPAGCPVPEPEPEPSEGGTDGSGASGGDGGSGGGDGSEGSDGGDGGQVTGGGSGGDGGTEGGDQVTGGGAGSDGGSGGGEQTPPSGDSGPDTSEPSGMSTLSDTGTGTSGGDDGAGAATAVVLRYTPAAGEPTVPRAHLDGVCAGTVYRTAPLPVG
ncbi:hypothetical protein [Streptomyces sp. GSL17-111]|uniref:hypothetical protein n=1 Tax=Streptomyces sp. GSL17-111 TaxID=3121596 RepID=UPI0030F467A5